MNKNQNSGEISRRVFLGGGAAATLAVFYYLSHNSVSVHAKDTRSKNQAPREIKLIEFSESGQRKGVVTVQTVVKSDADWKKQLTVDSYNVTRLSDTERPYTGKYWDNHETGVYHCVCCGTALFSSATKFESGTGWPSFWQAIAKENVQEISDSTFGMERTAVSCARCNAHLGHVFDDGPRPTGLRYCMNSVALDFAKTA